PTLAGNRLNEKPEESGSAAKDADMIRRRHLLIDVDPVRDEGSATDEERDQALAVRDTIRTELTGAGWPKPMAATMSGNGGGLIYRLDLPNDDESKRLVEGVLRSIKDRHTTDMVSIDTTVGNAARITKIPGTMACKGEDSTERPWRTAAAEVNTDVEPVDVALLRALVGEAGESGEPGAGNRHAEPIRQALRDHGISWQERQKESTLCLDLTRCPTGDHDKSGSTDTTILVGADGGLGFKCQHDTCKGKTWNDDKTMLRLGGGKDDADLNQAQILLRLAENATLFQTPEGACYAAFEVNGHRECWQINSKGFRRWLIRDFYHLHDKPPGSQALQDTMGVLESRAQFDEGISTVSTRIGQHDGRVYLDLANDRWEVVEIDADGWRIITNPPIYFRRPRGMEALPEPIGGGSVDELRQFLNIEGDEAFMLIVGWLLGAFRPRGPYPVLGLHGEPGSAKSSTARALRSLVDPNVAGIRSMPRREDDLIIAAVNGWLPVFDNLSSISEWVSDALCRMATGGGQGKRTLYSDLEETLVDVMRPVVLTGIGNLAAKPDLLDRSILIDLPVISDDDRVEEDDFWPAFGEVRPTILGALLDAASAAIRNRSTTKLGSKPRMADFARWVVAAESTLGWEPGRFLDAYTANRGRAVEQSLEVSPIFPALENLMKETGGSWSGEPGALLGALIGVVSERTARQQNWPKAPHVLSTRLRELAGSLRKVGYEIEFGHSGSRSVTIEKAGVGVPEEGDSESSGSSNPPEPGRSDAQDASLQPSSIDDLMPQAFGGNRGSAGKFER
ncbi:MAG: hypothetical protein M3451_03625, partial [Chloroflexota bacterium]|nr:hypothetical protein [Chloroflexota bacterium]